MHINVRGGFVFSEAMIHGPSVPDKGVIDILICKVREFHISKMLVSKQHRKLGDLTLQMGPMKFFVLLLIMFFVFFSCNIALRNYY